VRLHLFFTLLLTLSITACSRYSEPEAQIAANVQAMETALDERDRGDFMRHLARSFTGRNPNGGSMSREEAEKMLMLYFLRYRKVGVLVTQLEIEIDLYEPNLATTSAAVVLSGGEQLLPDSAGLYRVNGQWQNYDGDWKLTRLDWE